MHTYRHSMNVYFVLPMWCEICSSHYMDVFKRGATQRV